MDSLKEPLKAFARDVGFDAVGISRPAPTTWEKYADWLAQGYHGEMRYLSERSRERRDLSRLLENYGSVIVVAKNYLTAHLAPPNAAFPFRPVVSRYAWGQDYHAVMKTGLEAIVRWLRERTDHRHRARACVDTTPLLERDFAAQAGIGWIGKHTNLLSRTLGNWVFLGAVITTLELEPDAPVAPHCGCCARCLDACPTGAFVGPYVLDARRCISYLTIELKGAIPRELRPLIGRRVFGCDDCLAVCPWNRFALPTGDPAFRPLPEIEHADLVDWMGLSEEEFRRRFRGTPILRAKRCGFLRNAAVALGNTKDLRAAPALVRALNDPEPLVRGHAAWALGQIGGEAARNALQRARQNETAAEVIEELNAALK